MRIPPARRSEAITRPFDEVRASNSETLIRREAVPVQPVEEPPKRRQEWPEEKEAPDLDPEVAILEAYERAFDKQWTGTEQELTGIEDVAEFLEGLQPGTVPEPESEESVGLGSQHELLLEEIRDIGLLPGGSEFRSPADPVTEDAGEVGFEVLADVENLLGPALGGPGAPLGADPLLGQDPLDPLDDLFGTGDLQDLDSDPGGPGPWW